jgi:hypothetical protein
MLLGPLYMGVDGVKYMSATHGLKIDIEEQKEM